MASSDIKLQQLKLQHEIQVLLREDNGVSCHFDYHINMMSDDETIKLNVLTYNPRHNEYMLLHTVKGKSSIHCLELMKSYVRELTAGNFSYSFTIKWKRKGEDEFHTSYFIAHDEDDAVRKFLHEKKPEDFEYSVQINPIA